jgi:predicted phosphoribosyltransferase
MRPPFEDRRQAGRALASELERFQGSPNLLVLALPRGGVPVGYEVAHALHCPLDIIIVRKLGTPGHEELAMGALASGGAVVLNNEVIQELDIAPEQIEAVALREEKELARRETAYRQGRPPFDATGRTVLLVDDGLATGSSMRAAVRGLRELNPRRIIVAVPVAPPSTCDDLRTEADEVVCLSQPEPFYAVGVWYQDFTQTTDREVRELLEEAGRDSPPIARTSEWSEA